MLNGPRTAGRPYRARRSMFLMVDRVCCGGYAASASRFGGAALLAGSLYLYDVEGSTRRCWTGSLVSPCVLLSRRVFLFWWLLVVGIVRLWGMNKGGLSAFDRRPRARRRPIASTGARRRRACVERSRPPLSLWWLSSPGLVFREGEGATASFFFGRSLAPPLLCKKGRLFTTNMMVTTTTTT